MKNFKNKVVWITGASSGIGEATAVEFARAGAKLVLTARRAEVLEDLKLKLGLPEGDVLVLPLDVENYKDFEPAAKKVYDTFGSIDVLFNNAGISQRGTVLGSKIDVYEKLIKVNFFAVVALTKAVLPYMIKQESGYIAVTSSVAGKLGTKERSGYAASKHALHGFFDSLRSEIAPHNISVTIVCPGYIQTDISKNAITADGNKYGKMDTNQENGMPVDKCAKKILEAIVSKKSEVYMGGKEIFGVYLKRFLPKLLEKILLNQVPK